MARFAADTKRVNKGMALERTRWLKSHLRPRGCPTTQRGLRRCQGCGDHKWVVVTETKGFQNMPLWHKNYFKQKAFEFLKPLLCLKAQPPIRTQLSKLKVPPWEHPGETDSLLKMRSVHTAPEQARHDSATAPACCTKAHLPF